MASQRGFQLVELISHVLFTPPVIRVYDEAGNVIVTHEHVGEFKEW